MHSIQVWGFAKKINLKIVGIFQKTKSAVDASWYISNEELYGNANTNYGLCHQRARSHVNSEVPNVLNLPRIKSDDVII